LQEWRLANGIAALAVKAEPRRFRFFTTGFDPVRTGLVSSLNRSDGNATGVVFTQTDLAAKQLGLLHELAPKPATIAVLGDANQPELEIELREIEAAGRAIERKILVVKAANEREFNSLFATMVRAGARCAACPKRPSCTPAASRSKCREMEGTAVTPGTRPDSVCVREDWPVGVESWQIPILICRGSNPPSSRGAGPELAHLEL
jgi:hypothetical protein